MNEPRSLQERADDEIDHANARYNQKLIDEREHQRMTTAPAIVTGWRGNEVMLQRLGPDQESGNVNFTTGAIGIGDAPAVRGSLVNSTPRVKAVVQASPPLTTTGKIKYLYAVVNTDGSRDLYVAGWQKKAILVQSFPATSSFTASVDNLGGNHWSVNVAYTAGSGYVIAKISDSGTGDWQIESASPVTCYGNGFWTGTVAGVPSSGTTGSPGFITTGDSSHSVVTFDYGTYNRESGALAVQVWQGLRSTIVQPDSSSETSTYNRTQNDSSARTSDSVSDYRSHESSTGDKSVWVLPTLVLTNIAQLRHDLTTHGESHTVSDDGVNFSATSLGSSREEATSQSTNYSIGKINESGTAGLGARSIDNSHRLTTGSYVDNTTNPGTDDRTLEISRRSVWYSDGGIAAVAPEEFSVNGISVDVFEAEFAVIESSTLPQQIAARKDAKAIKVRVFSSTFASLRTVSVPLVYKPLLLLQDSQHQLYNFSYHP